MTNKEEKILPKYIGENIERSKRRKEMIDEIIYSVETLPSWTKDIDSALFHDRLQRIIDKLQELKKIS